MRPKKPRSFQADAVNHMTDMVDVNSDKARRRVTLLVAVPGGGKQTAVNMSLETLRSMTKTANMRLLWVVPRNNLKKQAAEEFARHFGSGQYLKVITKSRPPFMDDNPKCLGYVVTYQALGSIIKNHDGGEPVEAWSLHAKAMKDGGQKWLVVFDECHHLADFGREIADDGTAEGDEDVVAYVGGQWGDVVKPLYELSWHTIMMTGTPERHDGREIPFVHDRYSMVNGRLTLTGIDIQYKRMAALQEKAINVIQFRSCDGWAAFKRSLKKKARKGGEVRLEDVDDVRIVSEEKDDKKVRKIIRSLLMFEGYWKKLLHMATRDWLEWRTSRAYKSRMLVICDSQDMAIKIRNALRDWGVNDVYAATSSAYRKDATAKKTLDSEHGKKVLDDFREGNGQVLVTVAMAHEGFDAKDISHVVFLSSRRSVGWVTQAIDRGSRFDPEAAKAGIPWEEQRNFVYAPDDILMQKILDQIRADQLLGISPPETGGGGGGGGVRRPDASVIDAGLTTDRTTMVHSLDEIPKHLPRPRTETTVSVSPEIDTALLKEISKLARDRDVSLGAGKSKRTLKTDLPRMLKLGNNWQTDLKGESLVRIRDFLKKMVCPVA